MKPRRLVGVLEILEILVLWFCAVAAAAASAATPASPPPPGKLVDLGGHRLHVNCMGTGQPTVVVENGLGDFSFDWTLVQALVAGSTRICTYDRAGYAWSDPGPLPRTFAQLNLELHDALIRLGERPPFVLVGHSFGGAVARSFAAAYRSDVAGMVLVDAVSEDQRVPIGGKAVPLRDGATGRPTPAPREELLEADRPARRETAERRRHPLDALYERLPPGARSLHRWAQELPALADAEASQREWSAEWFAAAHDAVQEGSLGSIPLVVLTRADGGYSDALDVPVARLDAERLTAQAALARLSAAGAQAILRCGHSMHIEAPGEVAAAIGTVVDAVRRAPPPAPGAS